MKTVTIDDLFSQTLIEEYDADAPWHAVHELRTLGSREVFERAASWCASSEALRRARGADILAQLGRTADHPTNTFRDQSFEVLLHLFRKETETLPLSSAIYALGHIGNSQAVPLLVPLSSHPEPEVRFALAFSLGNFSDFESAAATLIKLTHDSDDDVRDWATFGLGAIGKLDTPEIRDALVERLGDASKNVRQEAIVGLARLRDMRVLPTIIQSLEQTNVDDSTIEAACTLLDIEGESVGWSPGDYAAALRERFGT